MPDSITDLLRKLREGSGPKTDLPRSGLKAPYDIEKMRAENALDRGAGTGKFGKLGELAERFAGREARVLAEDLRKPGLLDYLVRFPSAMADKEGWKRTFERDLRKSKKEQIRASVDLVRRFGPVAFGGVTKQIWRALQGIGKSATSPGKSLSAIGVKHPMVEGTGPLQGQILPDFKFPTEGIKRFLDLESQTEYLKELYKSRGWRWNPNERIGGLYHEGWGIGAGSRGVRSTRVKPGEQWGAEMVFQKSLRTPEAIWEYELLFGPDVRDTPIHEMLHAFWKNIDGPTKTEIAQLLGFRATRPMLRGRGGQEEKIVRKLTERILALPRKRSELEAAGLLTVSPNIYQARPLTIPSLLKRQE